MVRCDSDNSLFAYIILLTPTNKFFVYKINNSTKNKNVKEKVYKSELIKFLHN